MATQDHLLGEAEIVQRLLAVIDAHPDNVNPFHRGTCRYTALKDRGQHCLIGQLASDEGWKVPGPYAEDGASIQADRCGWPVTDAAKRVLNRAQVKADGAMAGGPLAWNEIRSDVADLVPEVAS